MYGAGFGDAANISVPQFPHPENRDVDNAYHIGSLRRTNEKASVTPTADARHSANLPQESVTSLAFCVLLPITLRPAFRVLTDLTVDLPDIVGEACSPILWPPCLTSGSTQGSVLGLAETA